MADPILVTGVAGFIGFHVARTLLEEGKKVVGLDNLSDYYDVSLKEKRLEMLRVYPEFYFHKADVGDRSQVNEIWDKWKPKEVIHLAAQAGVRYSIENPYTYIQTNVMGHLILLEKARFEKGFKHLVYASTSSVYGLNTKLPFSVEDSTDHPISVYAATKKMDELLSHVYTHLFQVPLTGLRFFTVYGPWGRPDMSAVIFMNKIMKDEEISVFNHGEMARDYTYIDDIVSGIIKALAHPSYDDQGLPEHKLYNIGNSNLLSLMDFIQLIEEFLGKKAKMKMLPMQLADVKETSADIKESIRDLGYLPKTSTKEGVKKLVEWYKSYYGT